jgi:multisubunit Na+/H+ antiporter MnhF subunit
VSPWIAASAVFVLALIPCAVAVLRGAVFDRLAALEMATVVLTLTLMTTAEGLHRGPFLDLAVALALLALAGSLVFVRALERWL